MNRLASAGAAVAWRLLLPLLVVGALAAACSEHQQEELAPPPAASSQPSEQQSAQAPADQATRQAAPEADRQSSEPQAQAQTGGAQTVPAQQSEQPAAAQPSGGDAQAPDDGEAPADADAQAAPSVPPALRPILGGYQFHQPIELVELADGSLLVAEQRGYITRFVEDNGEVKQFGILDLTESVTFRGEQGLLSMALHFDFDDNPFLFVYYSPRGASVTRLSRFRIVQGAAVGESELVILEVPQPYPNHNGGAIRFGPDGLLYLGLGDGGAANDPHGHGQDRETLLGAIIRIDVHGIDASTPYRIPTDNPFLGVAGVRPEIWAYGLRNPWRMAFDPQSGLLWAGDVGQNRVEEVIIVQAGENHGWKVFEGNECFGRDAECAALTDAVAPVGVYEHDEGCSVTGGLVYRGQALPQLQGVYIFGDYCSGTIWGLRPDEDAATGWARELILESGRPIASFAADRNGEIYVLAFNGPILKLAAAER